MRHSSIPLSALPAFPITGGTALFALLATAAYWHNVNVHPLFMNAWAFHGEPWRLITSTLLHGTVMHIFFNLSWHWRFGSLIENEFGPLFFGLAFVGLGAGSSAAQYALGQGGIGLSGVGYGLFGFLWMLSRNPRYRNVMDQGTVNLFLVWFVSCLFLDHFGVMPIANTAHASGLALGSLLGLSVRHNGPKRALYGALTGLALTACFLAATLFRPELNFFGTRGEEFAEIAYDLLKPHSNENNARVIALYEKAVRLNDKQENWWYNLGVAYARVDRDDDACHAFEKAHHLEPGLKSNPLASCRLKQANAELIAQNDDATIRLTTEALELDASEDFAHLLRAYAYLRSGETKKAISDYNSYLKTHPDNANALFNRAHALNEIGRKKEAVTDLQKYLTTENPTETTKIEEAKALLQKWQH